MTPAAVIAAALAFTAYAAFWLRIAEYEWRNRGKCGG